MNLKGLIMSWGLGLALAASLWCLLSGFSAQADSGWGQPLAPARPVALAARPNSGAGEILVKLKQPHRAIPIIHQILGEQAEIIRISQSPDVAIKIRLYLARDPDVSEIELEQAVQQAIAALKESPEVIDAEPNVMLFRSG